MSARAPARPTTPGAAGIFRIRFAFPGVPGVGCVFQGRAAPPGARPREHGNISLDVGDAPETVLRNRRALLQEAGVDRWAEMKQVHGERMLFAPAATPLDAAGRVEADGQATDQPGLALAVKTADCQPVLLAHESGSWVAALHVGWRGNRLEFPISAVRAVCAEYACAPREIFAVRGPSLGPAKAEFQEPEQVWPPEFLRWHDARTACMDLWSLTRHQLQAAGLLPERIYGLDLCTLSLADRFFSYRFSRETGRQAALIWIQRP